MKVIRSLFTGAALVGASIAVPALTATPAAAEAPPGRYCNSPDYGWVCFFEHSNAGGWSVGYTRCGRSDFPTWFWNKASSSWDRQYGGAYARAYGHSEGYSFRTYPNTGIRNVATWENDEADYIYNC
jgi:hypothetical protein